MVEILAENEKLGYDLHMQSVTEMGLLSKKGQRLEGTSYVSVVDQVAVVNLFGPIFPRANMMTASGATSIQTYVSDIIKAHQNEDIVALVQNGDTPGGDVRGIGDASTLIHQLSQMGGKPIYSFVEGYGASAGYYILSASQKGKFYGSKSSMTGSIGVIMTVQRKSANEFNIISNISKHKRPDPETEEGKSVFQEQVDDLGLIFKTDVMRNRGISDKKFMADYGQGKVMTGPRAQAAGLIDGISTLSEVIEMAGNDGRRSSRKRKLSTSMMVQVDGYSKLLQKVEDDEEQLDMGLKNLVAKFEASKDTVFDDEAQPDAGATAEQEEPEAAAPATTGTTMTAEQVQARREELEEEYSDGAELFAMQTMTDNRIFPANQGHVAADFLTARIDDKLFGGTTSFVNAEGAVVSGTREDACRARYAAMPKHTLTQKKIKAVQTGEVAAIVLAQTPKEPKAQGEAVVMTEERKRLLMGSSEVGQKVLEFQAKK